MSLIPKRQTRRRIAYWAMICFSVVLLRLLMPSDIGDNAATTLNVMIPSLSAIIIGFLGGEAASDHSARKNGGG